MGLIPPQILLLQLIETLTLALIRETEVEEMDRTRDSVMAAAKVEAEAGSMVIGSRAAKYAENLDILHRIVMKELI